MEFVPDKAQKLILDCMNLLERKKHKKVISKCQGYLFTDGFDFLVYLMLMAGLGADNQYSECIFLSHQLDEMIAIFEPDDANRVWDVMLPIIGSCYQKLRNYPEAIATLDRIQRHSAFSYTVRGISKFEINDHHGAYKDLLDSNNIDPNEFWNLLYLGRAERVLNNEKAAFAYWNQAEKISGHLQYLVVFQRAQFYQQLENLPAAIDNCKHAHILVPQDKIVRDSLVELLVLADRYKEALELAVPGLAHNQSDDYVMYCIAALAGTGSLAGAIQLFFDYNAIFDDYWRKHAILVMANCYRTGLKKGEFTEQNQVQEFDATIDEMFPNQKQHQSDEMAKVSRSYESLIAEVPAALRTDTAALIEALLVKAKSGNRVLIGSLLRQVEGEVTLGSPVEPSAVTAAKKRKKEAPRPLNLELPILLEGLKWPADKFAHSAEFGKHGGVLDYLEREWRALIEKGFGERRIAALLDPSLVEAIGSYTRKNRKTGETRKIPEHLRLLGINEARLRRLKLGLEEPASRPALVRADAYRQSRP